MNTSAIRVLRFVVASFAFLSVPVLAQQAYKAPAPPSCAKAPAPKKAECEAVAKAHVECANAKSAQEFGGCMSDSLAKQLGPFTPPRAPDCSKAPAEKKAQCELTVKANAACSKTRSVPEFNACMGSYMKRNKAKG